MRSAPLVDGIGGGISGPRAFDEEKPADGRNDQSTKGSVSHRTAKNTRALLDWRGAASGTLRFRLLSPSPVSSWKHWGKIRRKSTCNLHPHGLTRHYRRPRPQRISFL